MEETRPLYVMLSRTDTAMGKIIRVVTRYAYNHVSLSLDPQFRIWVSFARYTQGVPLAGGFVLESPERYLANSHCTDVRIFRIEISATHYDHLKSLFSQAGKECGLIYNSFGALATALGLRFPVTGAYTCLEFANAVLGTSYRSIRQLDQALNAQLIYEGKLCNLVSDNGLREDMYFTHRGLLGGIRDTARHFSKLFIRALHAHSPDPVDNILK